MDKITPGDIINFQLTGEGTGTGYFWYINSETHNRCVEVYKNGNCVSQYQTNSYEMLKGILEEVKHD